jgi:ABC-type multidrug transport system fused ATPase/permease subunit
LFSVTQTSSLIVGQWLEQYIHWLGWGELNNRVRAQVPAILFEKLMHRKNVVMGGSRTEPGSGAPSKGDSSHRPGASPEIALGKSDTDHGIAKTRKAIEHLFGSDALGIADFAGRQELLALTVVKLLASFVFLIRLMGWVPLIAGFASWLILLPLGAKATQRYTAARRAWVTVRDRKQAILSECVTGIRQIKFSARELEWEARILAVREQELKALWKLSVANAMNVALWMAGPISLAAVSLAVYATLHSNLTPSLTFGASRTVY